MGDGRRPATPTTGDERERTVRELVDRYTTGYRFSTYDQDDVSMMLGRAYDAGHLAGLKEAELIPVPDLDLLRRLASGEGGRRTGDLMRRGWIRVEVTEAGLAVIRGSEQEDSDG